MPALIQICIVMATIGLLAIAFTTVRMMVRFTRTTDDLSQLAHAIRGSLVRFDSVTTEARDLVSSLRDCVPPVLRVVDRFEAVGRRAADLSSALLDTVEPPVFTAAAVARGMKSGARHFLRRLMHRVSNGNSSISGGYDHE